MAKYAENTSVSVEKSKAEIEKTLQRYGAQQFIFGWDQETAYVGFTPEATLKAWEQGCRQRWRALALVIKAKLEAVETGITSFQDEFLAHILLPNGQTVGAYLTPELENVYQTKKMPKLLPF